MAWSYRTRFTHVYYVVWRLGLPSHFHNLQNLSKLHHPFHIQPFLQIYYHVTFSSSLSGGTCIETIFHMIRLCAYSWQSMMIRKHHILHMCSLARTQPLLLLRNMLQWILSRSAQLWKTFCGNQAFVRVRDEMPRDTEWIQSIFTAWLTMIEVRTHRIFEGSCRRMWIRIFCMLPRRRTSMRIVSHE